MTVPLFTLRQLAATVALCLAWIALTTSPALGQEVPPLPEGGVALSDSLDSVNAAASSLPDSLAVGGPGFSSGGMIGRPQHLSPMNSPYPELIHALSESPGSVLYDLGTPGWSHGYSVLGVQPNDVGVSFNGLPLDDLFFGRPRFGFVPVTAIDSIRLAPAEHGMPQGFSISSRDYDQPRPLTEALYWTSNKGLQTVSVTHSQVRRKNIGRSNGKLQFLFGYHGAAATGEYPSSKLQRGRQMFGRIRYEQKKWSFELTELYNRGSVGQHAGVTSVPIYRRLESSVGESGSERQTRRNDLQGKFRVFAMGSLPTTASVFYSRQTDVFIPSGLGADTISTKTHRFGGSLEHPLVFGNSTVTIFASGWSDGIRTASWIPDSLFNGTGLVVGGGRFHFAGPVEIRSELGFQSSGNNSGLHFRSSISKAFGAASVFAVGSVSPTRTTLLHRNGYANLIDANDMNRFFGSDASSRQLANGQLGFTFSFGDIAAEVSTFANSLSSDGPTLFESENSDSLLWIPNDNNLKIGYAATLGFRTESAKGFYATASTTLSPNGNSTTSAELRETTSVPEFVIRGSLGAKYSLFQGDLDANIYLRATSWSAFTSRSFNLTTALLPLSNPQNTPDTIPASTVLDVVLEAGIRTATLYVAYENALAGSPILEGNQLVSGYPLAEQRFRFGVHWPIFD